MRTLLITMLLLITVVFLYQTLIAGDSGMGANINGAGESISEHIRRMGP